MISFKADTETEDFIISGDDLEGRVDFSYDVQLLSWPYTADEGTGSVAFSNVSVSVRMSFPRDESDGSMGVVVDSVTTDIPEFSVDLDGGVVAWLVSIVSDILMDPLTTAVEVLVADIVTSGIEFFADKNMFDTSTCRNGTCQDQRLGRTPIIQDTLLSQLYGGTYYIEGGQDKYVAPTDFTDLPLVVNDRDFQLIFGPACFTTYLAALYGRGRLAGGSGTAAAATVAAACPEVAAAFPDEDIALTFTLDAAPQVEILYSAMQVTATLTLTLAPVGGAQAATFAVTVTTAGDLDFAGHHGDNETITIQKGHLSIELSPYDADAEVTESSVGDIAVTQKLLDWINDEFFSLVYDASWSESLYGDNFQGLAIVEIDYTDRAVIYNPSYVALTYNVISS